MMYSEKIVACIKVNGKVLRESGDTVTLPFGSEYSILLKNLHSVRAQVSVSIDGEDVAGRLVIPANSSLELERYIRNNNLESGNRFKFIERTAGVEEHRGIKADDGLIRVEAWKELVSQYVPSPIYPIHWNCFHWYTPPDPPKPRKPWRGGVSGSSGGDRVGISGLSTNEVRYSNNMASSSFAGQMSETSCNLVGSATNDSGITVPGSQSNQKFHTVSNFQLEPNSSVIVLRLRGAVAGVKASRPITVNLKPTCITCGKKGKAGNIFCGYCGTALQLI